MPEPGDKETRDEFIERCIPIVLEDGTAQTGDQAVAICNSLWREAKKEKGQSRGGPLPEGTIIWGHDSKETFIPHNSTIKAVGDWELEVLGVPFGGPDGGKDAHGEFFTPESKLHLDRYPNPAVHYYHGYGPDGKPQGAPEEIGEVTAVSKRSDGVWYRVVLDKAKELAKRVMDAARRGLARASSGTIPHLVRTDDDGKIINWPVVELSLFDIDKGTGRMPANRYAVAMPVAKALFERAGIKYPDNLPDENEPEAEAIGEEQRAEAVRSESQATKFKEENKMSDEDTKVPVAEPADIDAKVDASVKSALNAEREAEEKALAEAKEEKERIDTAVEEALEKQKAEFAKSGRLPWKETHGSPETLKYAALRKYDGLDASDMAIMLGVLNCKHNDVPVQRSDDNAIKAFAVKLEEDKTEIGEEGRRSMKAVGIKTDEVMHADLSGYGDDWVGAAYSRILWNSVRDPSTIASKLPSFEMPPGMESMTMPLEGADPTFYKVTETEDHNATTGIPDSTVPASQAATSSKTLSLVKMGARVGFSGELNEDSLIPFVPQLRGQMATAAEEQFEHVIIDGDTATGASVNINDIDSTPAGTEAFLLVDGFRKSPLVTTTANSRSGGTLTDADFLETLKLMGTAGLNGADVSKVAFIMDGNLRWKALEIATVKTRDIFSNPTIENGMLNQIWGYPVYTSYNMHRAQASRKANTSGKIDLGTAGNNTTGSLLAVRWDQWMLGWRRRITVETTRYPRSDSSEIVMLMRFGLAQRDTEASCISYNLTV